MSKSNRPQWKEPVEAIVVEVDDPIEDTIEVGEIVLVDGPLDPVSFGTGPEDAGDYDSPRHSTGPMPDLKATDQFHDDSQDRVNNVTQKAQDAAQGITDKAQDLAQGIAGKAHDVAGKAQDAAQGVAGKAQDVAQGVAGKAQDVSQKLAESASSAKSAVSGALDTVKSTAGNAVPATKGVLSNAASKVGSASATSVQSAGTALWTIVQRNPLQAIVFLASLVWLIRNNKAAMSQPPVSLTDAAGDAAEKVGTVAGQVQVAATNLSSQVQEQAQRGAGWFSQTLQENPLAIGAMAVVFGAGVGLAVPESGYEHKLLGETRDKLADKAQEAAQDLTQKVTSVAQTVVHEAVETVKEEAKNQGLTGQ